MTTATINTETIKLIDGDYIPSSEFENEIAEHEGSFYETDQFMTFNQNGLEVVVTYEICVDGYTIYDAGDYFTPPCSSVEVGSVDITIERIEIEGFEVELTAELVKAFEVAIDKLV
jgi:hypothetical protein